jgi:hypothetical protein
MGLSIGLSGFDTTSVIAPSAVEASPVVTIGGSTGESSERAALSSPNKPKEPKTRPKNRLKERKTLINLAKDLTLFLKIKDWLGKSRRLFPQKIKGYFLLFLFGRFFRA